MKLSGYNVPGMALVALSLLLFTASPSGRGRTIRASPQQEAERFPYYQGGKYGYTDKDGRVVIAPSFSWASEFSEGLAVVAVPNPGNSQLLKFGFIDVHGEVKIKPQFDYASSFSAGRAVVGTYSATANQEMRYGYIDEKGKVIDAPQFRTAAAFSENLALVEDERKNFGFIDMSGQVIIEPQFYRAGRFAEGLALAANEAAKYGYIDKEGSFRIRVQFAQGTAFSGGLAAVMLSNGKVGYIGKDGKFVINAKYDAGRPFAGGVAAVREGNRWYYITPKGERAFDKDFSQALSFSEGLAAVRVEKEWGYIDPTGEFQVAPQFATANPFSGGRALVTDDIYLKRRYIGRDGKRIAVLASAADAPPPPFLPPNVVLELAGAGFGNDTTDINEPVEVFFKSTPRGATVYLMRLRVWEKHPNAIQDRQLLSEYRFEGGSTPAHAPVAQKAYVAVFELGGRRIPLLHVEVMKHKDNIYTVDFTAP